GAGGDGVHAGAPRRRRARGARAGRGRHPPASRDASRTRQRRSGDRRHPAADPRRGAGHPRAPGNGVIMNELRAELSILTVDAGPVLWGIGAGEVIEVVREKNWRGKPPIDAARLAGLIGGTGSAERRVLLVSSGAEQVPILATGEVLLLKVDPQDVQ